MKKSVGAIRNSSAALFFLGGCLAFPVLISARQAATDRIIPLPEVETPRQVCVGFNNAYIADDRSLFIYDLKSGRFLKKVGKRGQGPGEFTMGPGQMTLFPDRLVVGDFNRIKYFSLDGIYREQIETPSELSSHPYLPIGRNFVGFPLERKADGSGATPFGCIYGPNLKRKKAFFGNFAELRGGPPPPPGSQSSREKTDAYLIREYCDYIVYKERIYVADSRKGLSISVFDENGDLLREIRYPIDKVKVPRSFVNDIVKKWKESKYWNSSLSNLNPIAAPFFPAFINFKIKGDRIYVVTAASHNDLCEVIVMDLEGKILERAFKFPLKPLDEFQFLAALGLKYDVEDGRFVWFAYNDTKEMYELHVR
jgi:hypothetical protein